jgi:catechol 2,3-dioxygenase
VRRQDQISDRKSPKLSTLHHFAIEISLREFDNVLQYLTAQNLSPTTMVHGWIGWRSIYVSDPDSNTVKFVSYDPSVLRPEDIAISRP